MTNPFYYRYRVHSFFPFPIDMLRYDQAVPATEADANRISRSVRDEGSKERFGIDLLSVNRPNLERWKRFHWEVALVEEMV